jgi:subtilase family serine protease
LPNVRPMMASRWLRTLILLLILCLGFLGKNQLYAQINRVTEDIDPAKLVALPNHHPQWANASASIGRLAADRPVDHLTLVLSRSPQQEKALQELLASLQDPTSSAYHRWLTPEEMGERFGLSEHDIAAISGWLRSQGLHVNWVSPSRLFLDFGGTANSVESAFHTKLYSYRSVVTPGTERISVSSDPMVPSALAPAIKAVRGLFTIEDYPMHAVRAMRSPSPELTVSGYNFITPSDFRTIYHFDGVDTQGQTIGIVGRSRTNFTDFANFKTRTGINFPNPTEVVPTGFGGVDPGPALTAPPAAGVSIGDQSEATVDVSQAGQVSNSAALLLVVATAASGGVEADAQYLVQTSPLPAQIMNISFGNCESSAGPAGVAFWDTLFEQAAAEGISVFVASGDSGASGCDLAFSPPPATSSPNSPNYICSSSYITCVGGTEFNDAANPSQYWSADNNGSLGSALSYIPEGAWNEPESPTGALQVAASGGGVSSVIATPAWQTGTGVPNARTGRYTPDVAFSAAYHDGYFGCLAAASASCATAADGSFEFGVFSGTSLAAPAMAGVAAMLDALVGVPQGNLAPQLYEMAASTPNAFHDVTASSSGVANCALTTPSLCNNSIAGSASLSSGQPGYLVNAGYDEVTGLGSLDIGNFLTSYAAPPTIKTASSLSFPSQLLGFPTQENISVENSGSTPLDPLTVSITGAGAADYVAVNNCQSTVAPLAQCQIPVTFTPSAAGSRNATLILTSTNASNSPTQVALSGTGSTTLYTPSVGVKESPTTITTAQALTITASVLPPSGAPRSSNGSPIWPTGSVVVTSGSYTSAAATISNQSATIVIPAGTLPVGNGLITAAYTPDSASASIYTSATGGYPITVVPLSAVGFAIEADSLTLTAGQSTNNTELVALAPLYGFTGSVALSASVTSAPPNSQFPPTFSFGSNSPVTIASGVGGSATLTITTTAPSQSNVKKTAKTFSWYAAGGAPLVCLVLLFTPGRRRRWRAMLGLSALLVFLGGGISACGGSGGSGGSGSGGSSGTPSGGTTASGTTAGRYVVTITGTSGNITETGTFPLVIN